MIILQVEILQVVEAIEYPVGQGAEPTLVEVQGMQADQPVEGLSRQLSQIAVVPQVELLQVDEPFEGAWVDEGDVV